MRGRADDVAESVLVLGVIYKHGAMHTRGRLEASKTKK